ncbi:putative membrane protein [Candidatus Protofrankia californiensis]|uniref:Putative membrane protein n=1 Tax=Candidatus Protofrankia californiensis TaxID=1839754 RepID=A0A1C3NVQ1_9ACTN|nr:putative membrane protein [Candidatus Protofrankia californiensis]
MTTTDNRPIIGPTMGTATPPAVPTDPAGGVTVRESLKSLTSLTALTRPPATSSDSADGPLDGAAGETLETLAAPWPVAVGNRMSGWAPVAVEPAEPAAVARYAVEGGWCAPYALGWRRAGIGYACLIALPATTTAYSAAWLAQWAGGIDTGWLPTGRDGQSRRARWLAARPPSLGELAATTTVVGGPRRAAAVAAVAASAAAYGLAWIFQRPGRLAAAALLAAVVWFA